MLHHLEQNGVRREEEGFVRLGAMLHPQADGGDQPRPQQSAEFAMPELA